MSDTLIDVAARILCEKLGHAKSTPYYAFHFLRAREEVREYLRVAEAVEEARRLTTH